MSESKLIVPIAAQALVVYDKIEKLNLSSRIDENSILGKDLQYDVADLLEDKTEDDKTYLEKGVHLHWKLPKLLKHGTTDEGGANLQFPAVPNRWMVVRYQTNIDTPQTNAPLNIPTKVWVVKSDVVNEDRENLNWVELGTVYEQATNAQDGTMVEKQSYAFEAIGKSEPLSTPYSETTTKAVELTAVGAVNPFFSAIYDECRDVFGFHDKMEDAEENDVFSYVITGWYSNPEQDPLINNDETLVAKIQKNWLEGITEKPTKTLFYHQRYNVKWHNSHVSSVPTGDVNISIGHNATEALSVHLKAANTQDLPANMEKDEIEVYLNALFNLLLEDERENTSIEKIRIENHKKQFLPKSRGILWEVKKIESNNYIEEKDKQKPFFPADIALAAKLRELNNLQVSFNQQTAQLKSLRQEYYFNWYKILLTQTTGKDDDSLPSKGEKLETEIQELLNKIESVKIQIVNVIKEINQKHQIKVSNETQATYEYELINVSEEAFWQPSDPALLLYGAGLGQVKEFYKDAQDKVVCRLSSQMINQLTVNGIDYYSDKIFGIAGDIFKAFSHDETIQKLVFEAFLLDPTLSVFTAIKAEGNNRDKESDVIRDFIKNHIETAQNAAKAQIIVPFACKEHTQAWEPQFMLWEVGFKPENAEGGEIICHGLSPMTDSINKTLQDVAPGRKYEQILSQNLSGFHKFLLAQYPCLQLPPLKYGEKSKGIFETSFVIDDEKLDILGQQSEVYALAPHPDQNVFSPIVEGKLSLKKLSLVDGFGQQRIVVSPKTIEKTISISKGLGGDTTDTSQPITLPKRIVQPTRLRFDWLNAQGNVLYQDTGKIDHPIMGWLVPNFLDNMVMIYDHQGHEVKSIRVINNSKIETYYPSKDGELTEEKLREDREAALDPAFRAIINQLDFVQFIKNSKELKKRLPKNKAPLSSSAVAMLYGTPIAVAKGKLRLELLGSAIQNPSWEAQDADTGKIEDQIIHLTLGGDTTKDDGLMGYFIGEKYYAPANTLPIKMNTAQDITVLLDAASGFYVAAEGGILPTLCVKLFPHAVEELSQEINISFMLSPFMSDKNQSYIPTPNTPDMQWNWIQKAKVNVWENPSAVKKSNHQGTFDFSGLQLYEGWIKMDTLKPQTQES